MFVLSMVIRYCKQRRMMIEPIVIFIQLLQLPKMFGKKIAPRQSSLSHILTYLDFNKL
jgi:hypothetical protein